MALGNATSKRNIVIIGGGAIGCCTAYYLSRHPHFSLETHSITLLEATGIADGSSGKGGGLLAAWAEPECLSPASFVLHDELARAHDGRNVWGYRRVSCAECEAVGQQGDEDIRPAYIHGSNQHDRRLTPLEAADWLDPEAVHSYENVGTPEKTAQCHPYQFTTSLCRMAREAGVKVILGSVTKLEAGIADDYTSVVTYAPKGETGLETLHADRVVVAAGAWSSLICPSVNIGGAKSHSVVMKPIRELSADMLFLTVRPGPDGSPSYITPEAYPRPDGTLYACEAADPSIPLPPSTEKVEVVEKSCDQIAAALRSISKELRASELITKQACYQPVVLHNGKRVKLIGPIIGPVEGSNVLIAAGHDSWGIHNAPVTGKVLAEIIFEGEARTADISTLSPESVMQRAEVEQKP